MEIFSRILLISRWLDNRRPGQRSGSLGRGGGTELSQSLLSSQRSAAVCGTEARDSAILMKSQCKVGGKQGTRGGGIGRRGGG